MSAQPLPPGRVRPAFSPIERTEARTQADEIRAGLLAHRDPENPADDEFHRGWNAALGFGADWITRHYLNAEHTAGT